MKKLLVIATLILFTNAAQAQTAYAFRVKFADKNGSLSFADSLQFLSQKSIDRRAKQGIMLDSTDLPVVHQYIDSTMQVANAVKLHNRSKWLNQIVIVTYDSNKINDVANLPFVSGVMLVAEYFNYTPKTDVATGLSARKFPVVTPLQQKTLGDPAYYGLTFQQINIHNGDYLHDQGYRGQGMTIAVLDAGFKYTDTHTQFDSLRNEGRLLGTFNFVNDTTHVLNINNDHGTNVTGLIIGEDPGSYIGAAPKANIYQLVTEDIRTEQPIEEDNWLSGAEWADSAGADIINGSLGYNEYSAPHASYTWANDLDGNSTVIAQAANMAVGKGIFTCVAQGNSGAAPWHYMLTPADADSAYSVGSVDGSGAWATSGYGPNADSQIKPNGVAMGKDVMLIGGNGLPGTSNGSSFASPLLAGLVSCLWQGLPTYSESQIRHLVMQCSDRFSNPNNTHGFGIPDFRLAYNVATGIDEFESQQQKVYDLYPNPTSGTFSIRVKQSFLPYDVAVYDYQGRVVSQLRNINNLIYNNHVLQQEASGMYFINLRSKEGQVYQTKLIKQ